MLIAYKQLVNKRCFLHTDAMLDFDDLWLNQDELENRVEYDYSVFMRMIKNDIDLVAEMVATFDSFLYLSADQRVGLEGYGGVGPFFKFSSNSKSRKILTSLCLTSKIH